MDIIDQKILELLKENSRMSFNEISENINKTEATVRRRVKKLLEEGIIKRFTVEYEIDSRQKRDLLLNMISIQDKKFMRL